MIINTKTNHPTLQFAAEELKKYLTVLDNSVPEDFEISLSVDTSENPDTDSFEINIAKSGGTLTGSNPRSVLYAVYNYIEALGVRWCRHGADGEYIPSGVKVAETPVTKAHTYSNKHRGMCIEGALSIENVLDNVDWAAKSGLNGYLIQGVVPFSFFDAWYSHKFNPVAEKVPFTFADSAVLVDRIVTELKKRDMIFHDVGHGWTTLPFGWTTNDKPDHINEEDCKYMAMVNGKRKVYLDRPLDTHLCYSNPEARKLMLDYCIDFVKKHPEIDVLHFWLADGDKNNCECENCVKKSPSDWLVVVLNELDARLSEIGVNVPVVIPHYQANLWVPQTEKLNNPGRFILQFSPIGRYYTDSYAQLGDLPETKPYELNKSAIPERIEENVAHLKNWFKVFPEIEAYTFEYYFWLGYNEHYDDFGGLNLAKIVYEDICNLDKINLKGMISCQTQRAFMPFGVGQYVYTRTLADNTIPFETLVDNYFVDAFGDLAPTFKAYAQKLSDLCKNGHSKERSIGIKAEAAAMLETINAMEIPQSECHAKSVFYVQFHCQFLIKYMEAEIATFEKGYEGALEDWKNMFDCIRKNEPSVQSVFDVYLFIYYLRGRKHMELKEFEELW